MNHKCSDDSCDAKHCPQCGGHKMDFYAEGICSSCELLNQQPIEGSEPTRVLANVNLGNGFATYALRGGV